SPDQHSLTRTPFVYRTLFVSRDADVTVVGAGPVGLVLAAELALSGSTVQVLERRAEPDEAIKAGAINVPTAEALDRRGLLPADHVARLDIPVRRGVEVTALEDTGDGVLVGTTAGTVRTGWLVGCDGGHSAVRRLAGIDFPGTDPELTGHLAVVDIADPEKLANGWAWSTRGAYRYGPQPGRVVTVEFDGDPADRSAPVTLE